MIKKIVISSLVASSLLCANELHVNDLVAKALKISPDLKISKADYDVSIQQVKQADADYLPTLDFEADVGMRNRDYGDQVAGNYPNEFEPGNLDTNLLQAEVTAQQLIYDFGKTIGNIDSFEDESLASKAAMQQSISDKVYAVKKAYYSYLLHNAMVDVDTENIKLNEQQLTRADRYYKAGLRTKVDVTDAQVNLIQAQLGLQDTGYAIKLSLVELKKEIGVSDNTQIGKDDIFVQKLEFGNVYESLPKLTTAVGIYHEEAYQNRPELQQFVHKVNSSKSIHKKVKGDYFPSIYANAEYAVQNVDHDAFAPEEAWKTTISADWNLYAGNSTDAINEEARISILRAESDLDNTRLNIQKDVSDAYIIVNKELDNTKLYESLTVATKEKFIQVRRRYEAGLSDYIDLQEARQRYIDSKGHLTQSYFAYFKAMAKLDHSVGK